MSVSFNIKVGYGVVLGNLDENMVNDLHYKISSSGFLILDSSSSPSTNEKIIIVMKEPAVVIIDYGDPKIIFSKDYKKSLKNKKKFKKELLKILSELNLPILKPKIITYGSIG